MDIFFAVILIVWPTGEAAQQRHPEPLPDLETCQIYLSDMVLRVADQFDGLPVTLVPRCERWSAGRNI